MLGDFCFNFYRFTATLRPLSYKALKHRRFKEEQDKIELKELATQDMGSSHSG